jgi:hypothetical protein
MSSAPCGLDVREYAYGVVNQYNNPSTPDVYTIFAANRWLVTRVMFFAGADPGFVELEPNPPINVAANGCLCLEPNGAFRGNIRMRGAGSLLVVEYWYQTDSTGEPIEIRAIL